MSICLYVLAHKHCCTACVLVLVIYVVYHATFSALLHSLSIAFPLLACHLQLSSSASFGTTERIPGARLATKQFGEETTGRLRMCGLILLVGESLVAAHGKTTQTHITWIAFNLTRSYITSQSARNFPQRFLNILSFVRFYTDCQTFGHVSAPGRLCHRRQFPAWSWQHPYIFHVRTGFKATDQWQPASCA